jgi:hypothetical protein
VIAVTVWEIGVKEFRRDIADQLHVNQFQPLSVTIAQRRHGCDSIIAIDWNR